MNSTDFNDKLRERRRLAGLAAGCMAVILAAAARGDELDQLLEFAPPSSELPEMTRDMIESDDKTFREKALFRSDLVESEALRATREREPEPGPGRLIYSDDFESTPTNQMPRFWANGVKVVRLDTPGNIGNVLMVTSDNAFMDRSIDAPNFRLVYDFLLGGQQTFLARVHGPRETAAYSLWMNENYFQLVLSGGGEGTLQFRTTHLWTGAGFPFEKAPLPAATIPQPGHRLAWHRAEIIMDDDRIILKLNGVRMLDGHYPVLMARMKEGKDYGFGAILRDALGLADRNRGTKDPWVRYDYYDNIEIWNLDTPVRERRWAGRFHLAPWGNDADTGEDPAHPWRTLAKAFGELRRGDRLTIQGGSYDESIEWLDPLPAEFPDTNLAANAATVIQATFAEEVKLRGAWRLRNPGVLHFERLNFAGSGSGLAVEGDTGKSPVLLDRLAFEDGSKGLTFQSASSNRAALCRCVFTESPGGLKLSGGGEVLVFRSVFDRSAVEVAEPARKGAQFIHNTALAAPGFPSGGLNNLVFASPAEAAASLADPAGGRYDPKPGASGVDAGTPLSKPLALPAGADMPAVEAPDCGAFEYYPPRELRCDPPPPPEKDLFSGELVEPEPIEKRAARLAAALSGLRPGDTLKVGPGLWSENGLAFTNLRGEVYAPILVTSDPLLGAAVHGSVSFRGCDRLTVEGFRFAGYKGVKRKAFQGGLGFRDDCGFTTIARCEITEYYFCGVGGDEQGVTLLQNWIHHNGVTHNHHGVYWSGEGPAWVIGNTFYANSGFGFHNHQGAYDGWRGWKFVVHHNLFIGPVGNLFRGSDACPPVGAISHTGSRDVFDHNTFVKSAVQFYKDCGQRENLFRNNIFADARASLRTNYNNVVSHNLLTLTNTFAGEAPVFGDPLFVAPADNDYRLKPESPANNAGINVGLDADPRPTLGAYDKHPEWAPPLPLPVYVPGSARRLSDDIRETRPLE